MLLAEGLAKERPSLGRVAGVSSALVRPGKLDQHDGVSGQEGPRLQAIIELVLLILVK